MKCDEQILVGIKSIRPLLGNASESTIIKWKLEYQSMPMVKIGGQWTTYRDEMRQWWHHLVTETLDDYRPKKSRLNQGYKKKRPHANPMSTLKNSKQASNSPK